MLRETQTVLLALPPIRRQTVPALGARLLRPEDVPSIAISAPLELLRRHRVGGAYWRGIVVDAERYGFIVSVSRDPQIGLRLWREGMALAPGAKGIVVLEEDCDADPFCRAGIDWVRGVEPHGLACVVPLILADEGNDLALLGAAYGQSVLIGTRLLEPGQVAFWLTSGVRWRSPFDGTEISFEDAVEIATDARRNWSRLTGVTACIGMAWWKRRRIAQFLDVPGSTPTFFSRSGATIRRAVRSGGDIAGWTSRIPPALIHRARAAGVSLRRIEDGFIRSVGLGSDLLPPFSIVADRRGIYFDATCESDLEHILKTTIFSPEITFRARRLIDLLIHRQVTKYGTPIGSEPVIAAPANRRLVLVPGQVADDLSIRLGSPHVHGNLELVREVRRNEPDAFIVFRPHPDVDAGHRAGHVPDAAMLAYADRIERGGSMAGLIRQADELHTMTSLAGFEALIRGKTVVTYGMPFYAGWGLTTDRQEMPRRGRRLTVEQLAAGVLLLYPVYLDPVTGLPCGPEVLISRLSDPALWKATLGVRVRRLQGRLRRRLVTAFMQIGRQS